MKWILSFSILLMSQFGLAKVVFLDVRTPQEFSQGHITGALNIDVLNPNFTSKVSKLNKEDEYKVYCKMGARACKAVSMMKDLDFKNVESLGSYEDAEIFYQKWQHDGTP